MYVALSLYIYIYIYTYICIYDDKTDKDRADRRVLSDQDWLFSEVNDTSHYLLAAASPHTKESTQPRTLSPKDLGNPSLRLYKEVLC